MILTCFMVFWMPIFEICLKYKKWRLFRWELMSIFWKTDFQIFDILIDLCMDINCNCLVRLLCYHIVVFWKMNLKIFYIIPLVRLLVKCHFWINLFWHIGWFFWFSLFEILIMRQFLFFWKSKVKIFVSKDICEEKSFR